MKVCATTIMKMGPGFFNSGQETVRQQLNALILSDPTAYDFVANFSP